jgi:hypothetical protein
LIPKTSFSNPRYRAGEAGILCDQVSALHLLLRATINLVLLHGSELATLYVATSLDTTPELSTAAGRERVTEALRAHRDDLQWTVNFIRVIHVPTSTTALPLRETRTF